MFTSPEGAYITSYERSAFVNWFLWCIFMGLFWHVTWPFFAFAVLFHLCQRAVARIRTGTPMPSLLSMNFVRIYVVMLLTIVFQGFMIWSWYNIAEINADLVALGSSSVESTFIDIMFTMEQTSSLKSAKFFSICGVWFVLGLSSMFFGNWIINNVKNSYDH